MDLTAGGRATAASAAVVMTAGVAVILYGIAANDLSRALGGSCLTMTALTLLALISIRKWTRDTQVERQRLSDATRDAESERTRYVALQAAAEMERQRGQRDLAAERRRDALRVKVQIDAMRDRFEEERAQLICDSLPIAVRLVQHGLVDGPPAERGTVVSFPMQTKEQPARERGVSQP
ncbi:hypothetical protein OIE71_04480 [Streptomyces sp. NBC_01725]|uniref:hypothetical protein n=1 Tax=Streptomyces sp. NBC_01725 TaxID=2975923 RepID=UPI002E2E76F8|nr:hypothetical protein [Streptomyces sp. NBC_01725]